MSNDFRRAIEEIKLRAPIEDVVREHVPTLKKAGALWTACCPFHEEKTPSFKVDPRRGTWHCYGACSEGGDQISFVERFTGLGFMEALEILAARSGVEIPKTSRSGARQDPKSDPAYDLLLRASRFYAKELCGEAGRGALEYLKQRGLSDEIIGQFGLGWAPASGRELTHLAREQGIAFELLEQSGLARKNDQGRAYDFFRGRLMIPIRDAEGRTVGFGARRLGDDGGGPKYINTPETELFKKNKLVYGFDQALPEARRSRHLILVEGYTDVMAAHQVGLKQVGAVLGTSTTQNHATLVRRCGAHRISLVFDGDAAGSQAARRALHGLLHLDVEIHIVRLPEGQDPCDLLLKDGAEAFLARIEEAPDWFTLLCDDLAGLRGAQLSKSVDDLLELIVLVDRPVHRQSLIQGLAERIGLDVEALREQWRTSLQGRRRSRPAPGLAGSDLAPDDLLQPQAAPRTVDPRMRRHFEGLVGAVLLDASLVPLVRPHAISCEDEDLSRILEVVLEMYEDLDAVIDASSVLTALGDHPARNKVASLVDHASCATSPKVLLEGSLNGLHRRHEGQREEQLKSRFLELEVSIREATDEVTRKQARTELARVSAELTEVLRCGRTPEESSPSEESSVPHVSQTTH